MSSDFEAGINHTYGYPDLYSVEWDFDNLAGEEIDWPATWNEQPVVDDHTIDGYPIPYDPSARRTPSLEVRGGRQQNDLSQNIREPRSRGPLITSAPTTAPSHVRAPPSNPTSLQTPTSHTINRTIHPIANYSEDWLDQREGEGRQPDASDYLPGGYFETLSETPEASPQQRPRAESASSHNVPADDNMAPTTRRRHARSSSIVDLTDSPSERHSEAPPTRDRKRAAPTNGESSRKRRNHGTPQSPVDELDLTNDDNLLANQQAATIATQQQQQQSSDSPQKIGQRTCIICMEPYTNATVTLCGHIYCHECLTQALKAGEKNSDRGVGTCPVCRKSVNRKKAQIVPVSFMKKAKFKRRHGH